MGEKETLFSLILKSPDMVWDRLIRLRFALLMILVSRRNSERVKFLFELLPCALPNGTIIMQDSDVVLLWFGSLMKQFKDDIRSKCWPSPFEQIQGEQHRQKCCVMPRVHGNLELLWIGNCHLWMRTLRRDGPWRKCDGLVRAREFSAKQCRDLGEDR